MNPRRRPSAHPPARLLLLGVGLLLAQAGCLGEVPTLKEQPGTVRPTDSGQPPADLGPPDTGQPLPDLYPPADLSPDAGTPPPEDLGPPDGGPLDGGPLDGGPADGGEPLDGPLPDGAAPPVPTSVDTILPVGQVAAGTEILVTCLVLGQQGEEISGLLTKFVIHPEVGFVQEEGSPSFIPQRTGEYLVTCQVPREGLLDATPARLVVVPADVHTVATTVDRDTAIAGESVLASCEAFDAFGNPVDLPAPVLAVEPSGEGVTVGELQPGAGVVFPVGFTRAGFYNLTCPADTAVQLIPGQVRIEPDLPAALAVSVAPAKPRYQTGEVVTLQAVVTDVYGNSVPGATVERTANPPVPAFGFDRFRFDTDGTFALTARVLGSTHEGVALSGTVTVVVSSSGPAITCVSPVDGGVANHPPGSPLNLEGQVGDPNGVQRVLVNGVEVQVNRGGTFHAQVPTHFGINFAEIQAIDLEGMASSSFCSFLVANRFDDRAAFLGDAVSFRLGQGAIDDGTNDNNLSSLGEILRRMLNSAGLVSTVDSLLSAMNPLYNNCEWNCPWPFDGSCCMRVKINYKAGSFSLPGGKVLTLQLVDGGLKAYVKLPRPSLGFKIETSVANIDGTVGVDYIEVSMIFDARIAANGRPAVSLRAGSEVVNVGSLWYNGSLDWLVDIVLWLFDGTFRNLIADNLKTQLRNNIDSVLDGVLQNLDIDALGQQFTVPALPGQEPVTIGVGVNFTRAEFNASRALFGFGMRLMGDVRVVGDTPGAPIPPGNTLLDTGNARTLGAAVSLGVLSKALFTAWQAGYLSFDATSVIPGLESAPAGTQLALNVSLPPVARAGANSGELRLGLGGARMMLKYPNLFDQPVEIYVAAEASAGASLVGDRDLQFRNVTVDRLLFRTPNVNLDPVTRGLLQDLLTEIVQTLLDSTVNGALPVLPIPDFEMPASLTQYGIVAGTRLGLRQPVLSTSETHFIVQGNLGER
ncbi:MAG: hypothetical protein RBU45_23145 [Myxococcota bacterium]|nr:hypothetical protein [Myxococcota bacterium]